MGNSMSSPTKDKFSELNTPRRLVTTLSIHNNTVGYFGLLNIGAFIVAAICYIIRKHLIRGIPITSLREHHIGQLNTQEVH